MAGKAQSTIFDVAIFTGVLAEQSGHDAKPQVIFFSDRVFRIRRSNLRRDYRCQWGRRAGAKITATRSEDSQSYSTLSDDSGRFIFANLPPGLYEVRVDAANFKSSVTSGVLVSVSNIVGLNISLDAGTVSETVTVSAGGEGLQMTRLALLAPGVVNSRQLTDRKKNVAIVTKAGELEVSTPRLREYFPETLLWQPSLETDEQGRAQLKFKLADNITTWKMS
jgi:hypothetical protein